MRHVPSHRLVCLILALIAAAPAEARRARPGASATVAWSHHPQDSLVVRGKLWRCEANRCAGAIAVDDPAGRQRACRAIVLRGHRVIAFETASGPLDAAALAACNGAAR